ncbi:MAG: type II CRISPR RNA-guided endonuclease Cas9 [Alphaproteobacteria bacterium]|nr:type II CRISPR RNA-guided endonuclease Cas9 [Alphaproteobacteria bacterium]
MHWRLGIDLGTNSLGWWAFRVSRDGTGTSARWKPVASLDGGVYIFPEAREPSKGGRVGDSTAVRRRLARGMRRNRDHGKNRIRHFVRDLIALGLLPEDEDERAKLFQTPRKTTAETDRFNPYRLRAEALGRPLTAYELGRALLHLGLRRGYKSNRKEASDEDGGKLKERIDALHGRLGGRTLGQYLWDVYREESVRERAGGRRRGLRFRAEDEFYPDRALYADEFAAIRHVQRPHHVLTDADWDRLRDGYILFQWPLKPVERGWCEFFTGQPRHWKDTPIAHDFRIHQELNALQWIDADYIQHPLNAEQRAGVLAKLMSQKSPVTFASLRKLKGSDGAPLFPRGSRFNLESDKRKELKPHAVAAHFVKDDDLRPLWERREEREDGELDDMFEVLHQAEDDASAQASLMERFGIDETVARKLTTLKLASGTANVSRRFMEQIVPVLADQGLVYSDAVRELTDDKGEQLHHSMRDDGSRWDELPYYGAVLSGSMLGADPSANPQTAPEKHFGKINNPTVHVALNSLRRVVNTLTERFGAAPLEVHVELTRDLKLPRKRRDEINMEQGKRQRENERIVKFCADLGVHDPSARDIKKVKLWEELGKDQLSRRCVFSGGAISAQHLFNGEAEIEHILPFSRTLDDSMTNLTVSLRWANRLKGNNTPHEAFSSDRHADKGIVWEEILQRADILPKPKRDRFGPQAMERFEAQGGFIARQLTDTAYMTRAATRYIKALNGVEHILANPGKLTAMVRRKWGLNGLLGDDNLKTREDHRHHAIDAAVVALIDRSVLAEVSRLTARGADDLVHIALPELDESLRAAIRARVPEIVTVFKPDHGLQGRMFNETAYGFIGQAVRDPDLPEHNLVTRKALAGLTPKECEAVRDPHLRAQLRDCLHNAKAEGVKHETALGEFAKETGIKRVRVLIKNQTVAPAPSTPYKGYAPDSYVCCDVWRIPPARKGGKPKWQGAFWSYAETVRGETPNKAEKKPHPAARFVTRLFKDDVIAYEDGGRTQVMRVGGFSTTNNKLDVRLHSAALADQNYVSINVLGEKGLRKLYVTPDGRIQESKRKGAS